MHVSFVFTNIALISRVKFSSRYATYAQSLYLSIETNGFLVQHLYVSCMEHSIFGCKVNKFYLNKWLGYFRQRQFDPVDGHLMATCVVTDRAKSKRVRAARVKLQQGKQLFVTGCGAFEKGEAMDYEQFFRLYPELV